MSVIPVRRDVPRRIATVSVHTSPLDQPGSGDAGGMNVYVVELSKRLAALGTEVHLDLLVRVRRRWRDDPTQLDRLGL